MSTLPGDVPEEQLKHESEAIKEAEGMHNNKRVEVIPEQTIKEVIPEEEPEFDDRLAILNERARKNNEVIDVPVVEEPEDDLPIWRSDDGVWMTRAKILGNEVEVPFEDLTTGYQKGRSADEKFREAATLRQENEALKAQLAQSRTQLSTPGDVGVSGPSNDDQQGITTETLNKAFLDGDEKAQQQLTQRLNQRPDDSAIIEKAKSEAIHAVRIQTALNTASTTDPVYANILNDPDLSLVADNRSSALMVENPYMTPEENILAALEYTADKLHLRQASQSTRTANKKNHARSNVQGGSSRQPLMQEREALTPEMVRAQMRNSRDFG